LLFMGEEWASRRPFLFFCDFEPELAAAVVAGRRDEFARFAEFSTPAARRRIPDPTAASTFTHSTLDWDEPDEDRHAEWLDWHRTLLRLRQREIVPHLPPIPGRTESRQLNDRAIEVRWTLANDSNLTLLANLSDYPTDAVALPRGRVLHATDAEPPRVADERTLPPWSVLWVLTQPAA
jgi:1,4-alpha-glucan branching enzyme